jgi:hypothetical protein
LSWKTTAVQLSVSALLASPTAAVFSSVFGVFFEHYDKAHGFGLIPQMLSIIIYRAIVFYVSWGFGWLSGDFAVMHVWLAGGTAINFFVIRRAAAWLYAPEISN